MVPGAGRCFWQGAPAERLGPCGRRLSGLHRPPQQGGSTRKRIDPLGLALRRPAAGCRLLARAVWPLRCGEEHAGEGVVTSGPFKMIQNDSKCTSKTLSF